MSRPAWLGPWMAGVVLTVAACVALWPAGPAAPNFIEAPGEGDCRSASASGASDRYSLTNDWGAPIEVRLTDCDAATTLRRPRGELPEGAAACRLEARRKDGQYWTPWVAESSDGAVRTVHLPSWTTGGLNVEVDHQTSGLRIRKVLPGRAGARAGLEAGDLLVQADGRSLAGLREQDALQAVLGPTGQPVVVGVLDHRTGQVVTRSIVRQALP